MALVSTDNRAALQKIKGLIAFVAYLDASNPLMAIAPDRAIEGKAKYI